MDGEHRGIAVLEGNLFDKSYQGPDGIILLSAFDRHHKIRNSYPSSIALAHEIGHMIGFTHDDATKVGDLILGLSERTDDSFDEVKRPFCEALRKFAKD